MKKLIILCCLLLLTGCTVDYDLYIDNSFTEDIILLEDDKILEKMDSYDMDDGTDKNINNLAYQIDMFESEFNYTRESVFQNNQSGYRYKYSYDKDKMNKKSMVYDCYKEITIEKGKRFAIKTSDEFKCFDKYSFLDEVNVNIHANGVVYNTNADNYQDGVYTWNINKDNYQDKSIYLEIEKESKNYTFDIVSGAILLVLILVSVLIIKKANKNSDI